MAAQSFNIAGKTPKELGQELTSHNGKGSGQQHIAPATARFKSRKIESL